MTQPLPWLLIRQEGITHVRLTQARVLVPPTPAQLQPEAYERWCRDSHAVLAPPVHVGCDGRTWTHDNATKITYCYCLLEFELRKLGLQA